MPQRGQIIQLKSVGRNGEPLWAFRYRAGGRGSRRVQRGGFARKHDATQALKRELERIDATSPTLAELVAIYLGQHEVEEVTLQKLRCMLAKSVAELGDRPIHELNPQEIANWRITVSRGSRFEATQALRQVLTRAVIWGMIDVNPAKLGVENPVPHRTEKRPFESWAQIEAVAANLPRRFAPLVIFAAATGLRPAEWIEPS